MNVWDALFSTQPTEPPQFDLLWYGSLFTLLALTVFLAYRYGEKKVCQRFFQILQAVQLILLYGWYLVNQMPLTESLPFYHCRLAMFVVLLLPGVSRVKQYFAVLGTFGTLAAFVYPVPDPYPFPHIAILSFIFGHLALFGNSLIYLLRWYDRNLLKNSQIVLYTFALDLFLVGVNQLTGGNYGLMARPPIMRGDKVWLNYLVVSSILALALLLFNQFFNRRSERVKLRK